MIFYFLFIFLFIVIATLVLFGICEILLPSLKNEGIELKSPIFSHREKTFEEKIFPDVLTNVKVYAKIDENASNIDSNIVKRMNFTGIRNCTIFNNTYGTQYLTLEKKCIGFGDCIIVCKQKAISIKNETASISDMCCGCGKCVEVCPINIISLVEKNTTSIHKSTKGFKFWSKCYKIIKGLGNKDGRDLS